MDMRGSMLAGLARQLGRPSGLRGRLVGVMLNRSNRGSVTAAVEALSIAPGSVVADVGFGGGVGLELLIEAVGRSGQVHGVEVSDTMLTRAEHRFSRDIADGRLHMHTASMTRLPLADGSLDGVITLNTIYFISELDRAFTELARVVKKSGRAIVGVGDPNAMARMPVTSHGFRLRPIPEVIDALRVAGLTVVEDRRVGEDEEAFHLLVAKLTSPPA